MDNARKPNNSPERKASLYPTLIGLFCGFLLSGLILLLSGHQPKTPITINPTPTGIMIMVQVAGEVAVPGVFSLAPGSRWIDAITMAGGFSTEAAIEKINTAAFLYDGQSIVVPSQNDEAYTAPLEATVSTTTTLQYPININYCSQEELETLPGIGPQKATAIIDFRNQNGNFSTIEDIMKVPGIGETIFNAVKNLITTK